MKTRFLKEVTSDNFVDDQLVADMLQFAKDNNVDEICASYQGRHDSNIEVQGFSAYDPEYDVYKVNG